MRLNEELARNPLKNNSPSTLSQPNTVSTSIRLTNLMTSNPVGCFGSSFVWVFFLKKIARRWWLTPWIPALHLWVWGQPGLQELVPGQAPKATEQPCLENQKKNVCCSRKCPFPLNTAPPHSSDAAGRCGEPSWSLSLICLPPPCICSSSSEAEGQLYISCHSESNSLQFSLP